MDNTKRELLDLLIEKSLSFGDFTLASGKKSSFYFDARITTLSSRGSYLIGNVLFDAIKKLGLNSRYIGGLSLGADPITTAVTVVSWQNNMPVDGFLVRKEAKGHGKKKRIEGHIEGGSSVIIVDDVATTGGSTLSAIRAVEEEGHRVEAVLCLVDREEGAGQLLTDYRFIPVFTRTLLFEKAGYKG